MSQSIAEAAPPAGRVDAPAAGEAPVDEPVAIEELLVEEISIDGMCGVY